MPAVRVTVRCSRNKRSVPFCRAAQGSCVGCGPSLTRRHERPYPMGRCAVQIHWEGIEQWAV